MKRHLKVRAELVGSQVKMTVLEQTHSGANFSKKGMSAYEHHSSGCFVKGKIILIGTDFFYTEFKEKTTEPPYSYMVLGCEIGDRSMLVPLNRWTEIKSVIEAYNKWGESLEED